MASQLMLTKTDKLILPRCSNGDSLSLFYMHKYFVLIWYISWSWEHLYSPDWACTAQIRQAVRAEAEYTNGAPHWRCHFSSTDQAKEPSAGLNRNWRTSRRLLKRRRSQLQKQHEVWKLVTVGRDVGEETGRVMQHHSQSPHRARAKPGRAASSWDTGSSQHPARWVTEQRQHTGTHAQVCLGGGAVRNREQEHPPLQEPGCASQGRHTVPRMGVLVAHPAYGVKQD